MNNKQLDMLCSAIFLVFGGLMLKFSLSIRHIIPTDVGSVYVPIFISVYILITAGAKLVLTLLDKKPAKAAAKSDSDLVGGLGTVGLMLLYVIAFEPVGFLLSSMVYLFTQILLMSNNENRKASLPISQKTDKGNSHGGILFRTRSLDKCVADNVNKGFGIIF